MKAKIKIKHNKGIITKKITTKAPHEDVEKRQEKEEKAEDNKEEKHEENIGE